MKKVFCKEWIAIGLLLALIVLGISFVGFVVAQITGVLFLACFVSSSLTLLSVCAFVLLMQKI